VLPDKTKEKIEFEFEEIESLFELYKKELFDLKQYGIEYLAPSIPLITERLAGY
jgi:hypothetical protein